MEITGPNIDGFIHATAADPEGGAAPAPGLVNAVGQWGTQPCIELRDQVEVFSLSQARWIPGEVMQVVEAFVAVVTYGDPGAQRFQKRVDLRDAKVIRPRADAMDNLRAKCAALEVRPANPPRIQPPLFPPPLPEPPARGHACAYIRRRAAPSGGGAPSRRRRGVRRWRARSRTS